MSRSGQKIKLLQARQLNPQQVQPRMAGIDEFALAGIERLRFLTDVQFNVQIRPDGSGTIFMSSAVPVKEPFLNFLVEVNWPSGRLVREYTVLLDPPVYDPTPATVAAQPARIESKVMTPEPQAAVVNNNASNIRTRADAKTQVYVDVNDTLWHIAEKHRPSASITEPQMMLALQRKNPSAFTNGNVNQLKAGVVLNLPTLEEAQALSPQKAKEEFWRQTAVWKQNTGKATKKQQLDTSKQGNVSVKSTTPATPVDESGQLKIVSSEGEKDGAMMADDQSAEGGAEAAELKEQNNQLEADLSAALETVDQIQRENQELSGRVDALAQQMESLQRLLELKDQQLAALQAELDAAKKQQLDAELAAQREAESGIVPTIMKILKDFGLYIAAGGAGLLALIGLLVFFLKRRKNKDEDGDELEQAVADAEADISETAVPAEEVAEAADEAGDTDAADDADELTGIDEEVDLDDLEDLTELDLEMDLDDSFEENPLEEVEADPLEATIDDQEFDLGLDDMDDGLSIDSEMDDDLAELDIAEVTEEADDVADELAMDDFDIDDLDIDTDTSADESKAKTEAVEADDELADMEVDDALDAILDEDATEVDSVDDVLAELDVDDLDISDAEPEPPAAVAGDDDLAELDADLDAQLSEELSEDRTEDLATEDVADELEGELDFNPPEIPQADEEVAEAADVEVDELEFDLSAAEDDDDLMDLDSLLSEDVPEQPEVADTAAGAMDEAVDVDDLMADLQATDSAGPEATDAEDDMVSLDELLGAETAEPEAAPEPDYVEAHPEVESLLEEAVADNGNDDVVLEEQNFAGSTDDELDAAFSQDLDADLDSELEALLNGDDAGDTAAADGDLDNLSLLDGADEVETKLDLARAYIDMEDADGAKDILAEIIQEGSEAQKQEANTLLQSIS